MNIFNLYQYIGALLQRTCRSVWETRRDRYACIKRNTTDNQSRGWLGTPIDHWIRHTHPNSEWVRWKPTTRWTPQRLTERFNVRRHNNDIDEGGKDWRRKRKLYATTSSPPFDGSVGYLFLVLLYWVEIYREPICSTAELPMHSLQQLWP
jgi:hypothetical protein